MGLLIAAVALFALACVSPDQYANEPSPSLTQEAKTEREARIFASTCTHCHVSHSGGIPRAGFPSDWNERETQDFDTLVQNAIDGYGDMPPLGTCSYCSRAEIAAMTALRVLSSLLA